MIAVDTNILVYSHRKDSLFHIKAKEKMMRLSESGMPWVILWPCILEFLSIVTHSKVYQFPTSLSGAVEQVESWMASPGFVLISETFDYWDVLKKTVQEGKITGPRMHDAKIAALCLSHHIQTLWTADRDFSRFPRLDVSNPLVD